MIEEVIGQALNNPWEKPQTRGPLLEYKILYKLDPEEEEFLKQLLNEPRVEFFCELDDEQDFAVRNPDGSFSRVSQIPDINGIRWLLQPGKNKVPLTIFEHLVQCPENRRLVPCPQPDVFLDIASIPKIDVISEIRS